MNDSVPSELACMRVSPQALPDAVLLADIRAGCCDCFAQLFRRYYGAVLASAFTILRDRSEAEDIAQEVFLSVLQKYEQYDPHRGQVKTWILTFAHFKALTRRRHLLLRRGYTLNEQEETDAVHPEPKWQTYRMNPVEWAQDVEKGLAILTSSQRRAIELIHFEGYTLEEVSLIMQKGLSSIKNHYYRGMRVLKGYLNTANRRTIVCNTQDEKSLPITALPLGNE